MCKKLSSSVSLTLKTKVCQLSNIVQSNTKIAKVSLHKHFALEEPTVGTSSEVTSPSPDS